MRWTKRTVLAVRAGDLGRFKEVLDTFADRFQQEKTWSLIIRCVSVGRPFSTLTFLSRTVSDTTSSKQASK